MIYLEREAVANALRAQITTLRELNALEETNLAQRIANYERITELARALEEWEKAE